MTIDRRGWPRWTPRPTCARFRCSNNTFGTSASADGTGWVIFKLTREGAAPGWSGARLYRIAGLFLFEFTVVLLGVLAAQAAADWAEDRRLQRQAEEQYLQARDAAIVVARVAAYWQQVGPCVADRARSVARAAASGATMSAADIGRPALPSAQMPTWDEAVRRAAYARYGTEKMDAIAGTEIGIEISKETSSRIRDAWATFALLDPANGEPSADDRANVRVAAMTAVNHVRLMRANGFADEMKILGVRDDEWQTIPYKQLGIDRCGMLVDWQK